jgi:hypothetical protein
MLTTSKIALSLALALGAASPVMAAAKHPVHQHRVAVERQLPGASAYGYASSRSDNPAPTDPAVLEALKRQAAGDPRCWGGNCDPNWGQFTDY